MVINAWLVVTGTMEFDDFPIILGISSSHLTSIFFRWVETTNLLFFVYGTLLLFAGPIPIFAG